nr:hypothetical protein [Armatimonas sp.]
MKIAFHFNCSPEVVGNLTYTDHYNKIIFDTMLSDPLLNINTKMSNGDLLLSSISTDRVETKNGHMETFNYDKYIDNVNKWVNPGNPVLSKISVVAIDELKVRPYSVYAFVMESVDSEIALKLHQGLVGTEGYIGMMQIDDASQVHQALYSLPTLYKRT